MSTWYVLSWLLYALYRKWKEFPNSFSFEHLSLKIVSSSFKCAFSFITISYASCNYSYLCKVAHILVLYGLPDARSDILSSSYASLRLNCLFESIFVSFNDRDTTVWNSYLDWKWWRSWIYQIMKYCRRWEQAPLAEFDLLVISRVEIL